MAAFELMATFGTSSLRVGTKLFESVYVYILLTVFCSRLNPNGTCISYFSVSLRCTVLSCSVYLDRESCRAGLSWRTKKMRIIKLINRSYNSANVFKCLRRILKRNNRTRGFKFYRCDVTEDE